MTASRNVCLGVLGGSCFPPERLRHIQKAFSQTQIQTDHRKVALAAASQLRKVRLRTYPAQDVCPHVVGRPEIRNSRTQLIV